jgi:large subunit ribosomal protein L33
MPQEQITLVCSDCQRRNYHTSKNKKNVQDCLELRKYCKWCRKHTTHKESK